MRKINEISLLLVFYGAAKISSPISVQIYKATLREVFQITSLIPKLPSWHLPFLLPSIHYLPSSSKVLSTPLILILSFLPCFLWIILAIFFPPFCLLVRSYISHFYCFISLLLLTMNTLWKKLQNNALPWFFFFWNTLNYPMALLAYSLEISQYPIYSEHGLKVTTGVTWDLGSNAEYQTCCYYFLKIETELEIKELSDKCLYHIIASLTLP